MSSERLVGGVVGAFLDLKAVSVFSSLLAANAAIRLVGLLVAARLRGGRWKLWLATFANPMMLAAIAFSIDQYDCLVGQHSGWNCMSATSGR